MDITRRWLPGSTNVSIIYNFRPQITMCDVNTRKMLKSTPPINLHCNDNCTCQWNLNRVIMLRWNLGVFYWYSLRSCFSWKTTIKGAYTGCLWFTGVLDRVFCIHSKRKIQCKWSRLKQIQGVGFLKKKNIIFNNLEYTLSK